MEEIDKVETTGTMLTTTSNGDATLAASPTTTLTVAATTTPMTDTTLKGSRTWYENKRSQNGANGSKNDHTPRCIHYSLICTGAFHFFVSAPCIETLNIQMKQAKHKI